MHIIRPYVLVNVGCVMLGRIIAQILFSRPTKKLSISVFYHPRANKLHSHGAGVLPFDGVVD
jgi:hypothetical protein